MNNHEYIGQIFTVIIDRPMGSSHPEYGFKYPVNYGYVPGVMGKDNEELDAYVLGIFAPVDTFKGRCIAIIHRLDDNDDKLVLVPEGKDYTIDQIAALTEFQERFFAIQIHTKARQQPDEW